MNNYRTIQQKDMHKLFPHWGNNIPTLGNKCSQPGNKTGLRLALSLLLMFVLGINTAWGQDPKVSDGIYYIRNNATNQGYLWPSLTTNTTTGYSYLTTSLDISADAVVNNNGVSYSAHDKSYSHWVVKNVTGGYIQLINPRLNKYVVIRQFPKANNSNGKENTYGDRDVWLTDEPTAENIEYTYFVLNNTSSPYKISPKAGLNGVNSTDNYTFNSAAGDDRVWLTWSKTDNKPQKGEGRDGLIQLYSGGTPAWSFTSDLLDAPTISDVDANSIVTVTDANGLPDGYNIRYTTDGEDPTASSPQMANKSFTVESSLTLKVVVERYGIVLTKVAEKSVVPAPCATPVITFDNTTSKVSISCATEGSTIYYTTEGETPTKSSTPYSDPFSVTSPITVKAIATHTIFSPSAIAELMISQVATPTIQDNGNNAISITTTTPDATIYYTTDGSTPTTSSTEYTEALSDNVSNITIKAIAVKEGMITSAVGSGSVKLQCATPVITRNGLNFTLSCSNPTDATFYYSLDGTTPATLYNGAVSFTSNQLPMTVTAVARHSNYTDSETSSLELVNGSGTTDDPYMIYDTTDLTNFVTNVNNGTTTSAYYKLGSDISASGMAAITTDFTGVFDGNGYIISNLGHALFNTVNGGTVKNVMLQYVKISGSGSVGAIAGVAKGYSRIYNCGILPSNNKYENETSYVLSSDGYCGGLVGWLKDDSRVINCFSYANINGGTDVAGIVGHVEAVYSDENGSYGSTTEVSNDDKYYRLKSAVVNCMFYGNITSGTHRYPVYGGAKMLNNTETGINNYDFYRAEASVVLDDSHYNCSWPAKEEYLTKYEFYRYLLNSNRELCGWWVGAPSAPSEMSTTDVQAVPKDASLIAKWVLDPSMAPYPILKPAGKYFSVINQDPNNRINPDSKTWESRLVSSKTIMTKAAPDTEGQKLGSVTVTINKGGELSGSVSKDIPITAMDINNNDFCYGKIQLPYYNSIFGNSNSNDWDVRYGGNYKDKVVVGWEITSATGDIPSITNNSGTGYDHTYSTDAESGYNFADRYCTTKDENRVFAQGGYYYVPYGVSAISITARWATATYLDNNDHYYDRISVSTVDDTKNPPISSSSLSPFEPAGTRPTLGNGKEVKNGSISDNLPNGSVYDNAIVLVGNHQYFTGNANIGNTAAKGCTIMSADFNLDDEPDNCLIWELGSGTSRYNICSIRFDFLPVVEMGLAMKEDASTQYYALGCYRPLGHYEVTETSLIRFGQFEFGNSSRSTVAPLILNGGIFDQYCKGTQSKAPHDTYGDYINYIILGGNVKMPSFTPGAHVRAASNWATRHCPVNVMGGNIDYLYLTGNYNDNVTPNQDNPHCNIDGGVFKQVAAAAKEGIDGDVYFNINHSIIQEFYGGSTMDQTDGNNFKIVKGNIDVTIDNSMVTKYCGGPKFGNMNLDSNNPLNNKTVTTRATGTTFGVYYGGGNGGTSYVQYNSKDITNNDASASYDWDNKDKGNLTNYTPGAYYKKDKNDEKGIGYKADYEMEIVNSSTGSVPNQGIFRTYFYAAQFSATNTGSITNILTDCHVLTSFYGGGNLGGVKGDVMSTLTNTEVTGSAFGAGYSASVPEVTIYNKDKTPPTINVYTGIITPTPEGSGSYKTYTWTNETSLGGKTLSTSNPAVENVNGKNYFYTEEPLVNLGAVSGAVTLTINGNSNIGHDVFGGGDSSAVINTTNPANASTTVKLQGNAQVQGDVFGGGNQGLVSGTATVNVEQ